MPADPSVFLFDVDNTLLDNDRVSADVREYLLREVGSDSAAAYWRIFEQLRTELGYADYLGALQRLRTEKPHDQGLFTISRFLFHYPFSDRLYPSALETITHLKKKGTVAILSDGDVVFQPLKIERSGIWDAVDGNVLIYVHKEQETKDIERRIPAQHYILVDDKIRILTAMKKIWKERLTTVFVKQGHYALDTVLVQEFPAADITIENIQDICKFY